MKHYDLPGVTVMRDPVPRERRLELLLRRAVQLLESAEELGMATRWRVVRGLVADAKKEL